MCPSVLLPPSRLRNIRIAITLKCKSDYSTTSVILHEACSWLQQIQRLSLVLELQLFPGMERYFCILEPLMSLREVHKFSMRHNNNSYDTTSLIKQDLLSSKLGCKHRPNIQPSVPVGAPSDYARYLRQVLMGSRRLTSDYQDRQLYRGLVEYVRSSQVPQQYKDYLTRLGTHSSLQCHKGPFELCAHRQMLFKRW